MPTNLIVCTAGFIFMTEPSIMDLQAVGGDPAASKENAMDNWLETKQFPVHPEFVGGIVLG